MILLMFCQLIHSELQVLDLASSYRCTKGCSYFTNVSNLEVLRIPNSNIKNSTTPKLIANVIESNIYLKELDLSNNNLKFTEYENISKALQKLPALTSLFLSGNNINDKVANLFCNTQINELNLSGNNPACTRICRSLQRVSMLTKFYLNNNNISCDAAYPIKFILTCNTQINELDLIFRGLYSL